MHESENPMKSPERFAIELARTLELKRIMVCSSIIERFAVAEPEGVGVTAYVTQARKNILEELRVACSLAVHRLEVN